MPRRRSCLSEAFKATVPRFTSACDRATRCQAVRPPSRRAAPCHRGNGGAVGPKAGETAPRSGALVELTLKELRALVDLLRDAVEDRGWLNIDEESALLKLDRELRNVRTMLDRPNARSIERSRGYLPTRSLAEVEGGNVRTGDVSQLDTSQTSLFRERSAITSLYSVE